MKPTFALNLDPHGIGLLHRAGRDWQPVGEVAFDDPELGSRLAYLRSTALGLEKSGLVTKLVIPASQILYTTVTAPGPDARNRRRQIRAALDGLTPYAVDELVFDWSGKGDAVQVAVVARETLLEAEAFATEHRFCPISFVALPDPDRFEGEPFFGPTSCAADHMPDGARVRRDDAPVWLRETRAAPEETEGAAAEAVAASEAAHESAAARVIEPYAAANEGTGDAEQTVGTAMGDIPGTSTAHPDHAPVEDDADRETVNRAPEANARGADTTDNATSPAPTAAAAEAPAQVTSPLATATGDDAPDAVAGTAGEPPAPDSTDTAAPPASEQDRLPTTGTAAEDAPAAGQAVPEVATRDRAPRPAAPDSAMTDGKPEGTTESPTPGTPDGTTSGTPDGTTSGATENTAPDTAENAATGATKDVPPGMAGRVPAAPAAAGAGADTMRTDPPPPPRVPGPAAARAARGAAPVGTPIPSFSSRRQSADASAPQTGRGGAEPPLRGPGRAQAGAPLAAPRAGIAGRDAGSSPDAPKVRALPTRADDTTRSHPAPDPQAAAPGGPSAVMNVTAPLPPEDGDGAIGPNGPGTPPGTPPARDDTAAKPAGTQARAAVQAREADGSAPRADPGGTGTARKAGGSRVSLRRTGAASRAKVTAQPHPPAEIARQPATEAEAMTVFGARSKDGVGGKPRHLGLFLTLVLLVLMAVVAIWSLFFLSDDVSRLFDPPEPTELASAPDTAPAAPTALPGGADSDGAEATAPAPANAPEPAPSTLSDLAAAGGVAPDVPALGPRPPGSEAPGPGTAAAPADGAVALAGGGADSVPPAVDLPLVPGLSAELPLPGNNSAARSAGDALALLEPEGFLPPAPFGDGASAGGAAPGATAPPSGSEPLPSVDATTPDFVPAAPPAPATPVETETAQATRAEGGTVDVPAASGGIEAAIAAALGGAEGPEGGVTLGTRGTPTDDAPARQGEGGDADRALAALPQPPDTPITLPADPVTIPAAPNAPLEPLSDAELAARYPDSGIWPIPPQIPGPPRPRQISGLQLASIDPSVISLGGEGRLALPALRADTPPDRPADPPGYVPLAAGAVEGDAPASAGVAADSPAAGSPATALVVIEGRPPVVPPRRDPALAPDPFVADPALSAIRPRSRPPNLTESTGPTPEGTPPTVVVQADGAADGSTIEGGEPTETARAGAFPETGAETDGLDPALAAGSQPDLSEPAPPSVRPRTRPASIAEAAAEAEAAAVAAAAEAASRSIAATLAASPRPADRPARLAAAAVAVPAPALAAAPATNDPEVIEDDGEPDRPAAAPAIPTRASVAARATVTGAVNLRRVNLIGVFGTSSSRRALVRMPSGRMVQVRVGDRLDGGQVAAIDQDRLIYVKNGRNEVLEIPEG